MSRNTRIYISDLDGTLLRNDATISDFARDGLLRLLGDGVSFTIASARSLSAMRIILGSIPFNLPVIEFNGSFLSDFKTGRHEVINSFDKEVAEALNALVAKNHHVPFLSTFDGREDCLYCVETTNAGMQWYFDDRSRAGDKRLRSITALGEGLKDQVVCFIFIDRREPLEDLARQINEAFGGIVEISFYENRYSRGWYWLTVHDFRASKDQAIRLLLERLGIGLDGLTVFGDDANDLKMFQMAGRSVAVGNAIGPLKACAHEVIGNNEEDSVIKYILEDSRAR